MSTNDPTPSISVVLALYNGSRYIEEQLSSILNQTYQDFELIIIDDASIDNSIKLIETYLKIKQFENYLILKNKINIGPNGSFELGIKNSQGEFIAFCDQDDIWLKNKLEVLINKINEKDTDLVFSQSLIMQGRQKTKRKYPKQNHSKDLFIRLQHNNARGAAIMARRSILERIIPFSDSDIYDKWIYFISIITGSVYFNNVPLDYYRAHSENVVGINFKYSSKSEIILKFASKIQFYKDLTLFLETQNYTDREVFTTINSIIEFYESMRRCLEFKNLSCLKRYIKFVLLKDFYVKEKLIFLYYYLMKKK